MKSVLNEQTKANTFDILCTHELHVRVRKDVALRLRMEKFVIVKRFLFSLSLSCRFTVIVLIMWKGEYGCQAARESAKANF